jgi:hypothetical protein
MSHGDYEFDVAATFATHFLLGHLYTASIAGDTLVADTLVLSAVTLVVLDRTEDSLAEETVSLRFVCTIIDSLRLQHLAV